MNVALLDADAVFGRYGCDQRSAEVVIDVCRKGELRFTQAQAPHPRPNLAERRHKSVDPERVRVLGKIRIDAVQDHRNGRVHRVLAGRPAGGLNRRLLGVRHAPVELPDLLAQRPQLVLGLRSRGVGQAERRRDGERHGCLSVHVVSPSSCDRDAPRWAVANTVASREAKRVTERPN